MKFYSSRPHSDICFHCQRRRDAASFMDHRGLEPFASSPWSHKSELTARTHVCLGNRDRYVDGSDNLWCISPSGHIPRVRSDADQWNTNTDRNPQTYILACLFSC